MRDSNKPDWYDPKAFRSDPFDPFPPPSSGGNATSFIGWLLIWALIGGGIFLYFQGHLGLPEWARPKNLACTSQPLPPSGATGILDPAMMRRSDALFSTIEFRNGFDKPIAAYLMSPTGDGMRYAVAHVSPGMQATLSAPVGAYGITLEYGSRWCGNERGYGDGTKLRLTTNFSNEAGKSGKIIIVRTATASPAVSYAHAVPEPPPPVFQVSGRGYIELRQNAGGHYSVNGTIGGTPLLFMLDTGATVTSVSNGFALRAQIPLCRPTTTNTANGVANACMARVPELSFGNFRVTDVDVMILPQLVGSEALLGMNVLRHFGIEQRNGVMRISAP